MYLLKYTKSKEELKNMEDNQRRSLQAEETKEVDKLEKAGVRFLFCKRPSSGCYMFEILDKDLEMEFLNYFVIPESSFETHRNSSGIDVNNFNEAATHRYLRWRRMKFLKRDILGCPIWTKHRRGKN